MGILALGLVLGSGLRVFCHGGGGMWSGVLRECFFSKCVCSMSTIRVGCVVTSLVFGSRMASSLGWSLALGCRPAAVLRLLWERLGFLLYS